jgi:hypothetical protein
VSLLLDALKRAEEEKQARPPEEREGRGPHLVAAGKPVLELQPVAAEAASPAARSPSKAAAHAIAPAPSRKRRNILWIAAAAIVFVIVGAAGYVWHSIDQLQPRPAARAARLAPVPAAPAPAAVSAPLAQLAPPSPEPRPAAAPPAPPPATPSPLAARPVAPAVAAPAVLQPAGLRNDPASPRKYRTATRRCGAATSRKRSAAIPRRSRTTRPASTRCSGSRRWKRVSTTARRPRRSTRRALEIDPRNASALAGLAGLSENARPEVLESRLLRDLAEQPGSAALQFMLGNLYAAQGRWGDAQAAYFEAHRLDPGSADIAYNLAVSLDHLGQDAPPPASIARRSRPAAASRGVRPRRDRTPPGRARTRALTWARSSPHRSRRSRSGRRCSPRAS